MRESIGSTWILQLVIGFILIFVAFLTLSLGYSKSYKMRNEALSIIEKYEGLTPDAISIINNYLEYNNYRTMGTCPDSSWYGVDDYSSSLEHAIEGEKYYYCIKKYNANHDRVFYEVKVFFKFNLPILGDFATFTIEGTTNDIESFDTLDKYTK